MHKKFLDLPILISHKIGMTEKYHKFHTVKQSFRFYLKSNQKESRSSKNAIFAILEGLNFVNLVNFRLQKVQKLIKVKFRVSKCSSKMSDFLLLEFPKLISRKM